jgi:ATP adenylyltransferase
VTDINDNTPSPDDFNSLKVFLLGKMAMTHVYQPVIIKELLKLDGRATTRQLSMAVLAHDEGHILRYQKLIKRWPSITLQKHGVISVAGDMVELNFQSLSYEQRMELISLCEVKLSELIASRGLNLWDSIWSDDKRPSAWYEIHVRDNWTCCSCGVHRHDDEFTNRRPFHVDHIKPKSKGGNDSLENLQLLCSRCNLSKGNMDDTDLRKHT